MARDASDGESAPAGVFGVSAPRDEESGRFAIDTHASRTRAPEADATGEELDIVSLEALEAASTKPLERRSLPPRSLPPPVPAAALSHRPPAPAPVSALQPYYPGLSVSERVELNVDDLSLALDNPYARSSLMPPARKSKAMGLGLVWATLAGFGLVAGVAALVLPEPTAKVFPPQPVAAVPRSAISSVPVAAPKLLSPTMLPTAPAEPIVVATPVAVAVPTAPSADVVVPAPQAAVVPANVAATKKTSQLDNAPAPESSPRVEPAATPVAVEIAAPTAAAVPPAVEVEATPTAPATPVATETTPEQAGASITVPSTDLVASPAPVVSAPAPEALPETPSSEQLAAGFEKIRADVEACVAGAHGRSVANVTIAGASGRVTYAMIEGAFVGTPEGSCIARNVRRATFPRFSSTSLKIVHPFVL